MKGKNYKVEDKADQLIKKRQHEYIRDTFIIILVLVVVITGIALTIHFVKKNPTSIVLYNEKGEALGTYSQDGDVNIPNKKGYQSVWVSDDGTTYESIDAALSNGEKSVKQSFTPIQYTVTLYMVGGSLADGLGYEYHQVNTNYYATGDYYTKTYTIEDEDFDLPAIKNEKLATKRGATFAFWSDVNYVGSTYAVENLKATEVKTISTQNARDVVLYAAWKDNMCSVQVHGFGGGHLFSVTQKETSLLSEEALREEVISRAKEGYTFIGFYADSNLNIPFDFSQEINQKVVSIYTKWKAPEYTLTFKDFNDSILQSTSLEVGSTISFYDYTSKLAPGKAFDTWLLDDEPFTSTKMLEKDITLYPSVTNIPYTITWFVDEERQAEEIYYYGDEPQAPTTLNTDKAETESLTFVFDGWTPSLTSVSDNKTYTAKYKEVKKKFTYSIEANGINVVSPTLVEYGTDIEYPSNPSVYNYTKDGYNYTFEKWVIKDTDITPTQVTTNMEIVAQYTFEICHYTVSWEDKDGNTIQVNNGDELVDSLTIDHGKQIDLNLGYPNIIHEYIDSANHTYIFNGWTIGGVFHASTDSEHNLIETLYTVTSNITIIASYEVEDDKAYYVLKDENGNTITQNSYFVEDYEDLFAQIMSIERTKASDNTYTYTFDGWYFDNSGVQTKLTSATQLPHILPDDKDKIIVLQEVFTSDYIPYTITWKFGNDDEVSKVYHYGDTLDPDGDLAAESKTTDKASTVSTVYTFDSWNYTSDIVTKSITYTAIYTETPRPYTYQFLIGLNVEKESTIGYGSVIVAPVDPQDYADVEYSYTFVGWFEDPADENTLFEAGTTISQDITYYAKFNATKNQYTYIFFLDDGETVYEEATLDYGSTVTKPTINPSKAQTAQYTYTFAKWVSMDDESDYEDNQTLVGNVSYKAVFTPTLRSYTYTFHNEESEFATDTLDYGETINIASVGTPEKATLANKYTYEFAGWYLNSDFSGDPVTGTITVQGELHFYAKYNEVPVIHTITFITGSNATAIAPMNVGYGQSITAPSDPTRPNYTFQGWDNEIPATMGEENLTFTALWEAIEYTITYNLNGGSETENITKFTAETASSALVLAKDSTKTGYTLNAWKYQGTTVNSIADTGVIGDLTIDAYFVANEYTVTYVPGEGASVSPTTKTVTYDSTFSELATPTRTGYTFLGWYSDTEYTAQNLITSSTQVAITSNINVYAKWEITTYHVYAYVGNSLVNTFDFDILHEVELTTYANDAYDFGGWYLQDITNPDIPISSFEEVTAYGETTGNINVYGLVKLKTLTITGNTVTEYTGEDSNVVIPRIWNDVEVTTIGENAFKKNNHITSVDAQFITTIETAAFRQCKLLQTINLANIQTIGDDAFMTCEALTAVDLSNATSIGNTAFAYSGVSEVTISTSLTTLGEGAFYNCEITAVHYNGTQADLETLVNNSEDNENLLIN